MTWHYYCTVLHSFMICASRSYLLVSPARVLKPLCDFTYGVFLLLGFFKGRAARLPLPVVDGHGGVDPATVAILPPPEVPFH